MTLTKSQQTKIEKLAKAGHSAATCAGHLKITVHEAYCNDDFCIAFSKGYEQRVTVKESEK